jgi:hypothetical protein
LWGFTRSPHSGQHKLKESDEQTASLIRRRRIVSVAGCAIPSFEWLSSFREGRAQLCSHFWRCGLPIGKLNADSEPKREISGRSQDDAGAGKTIMTGLTIRENITRTRCVTAGKR